MVWELVWCGVGASVVWCGVTQIRSGWVGPGLVRLYWSRLGQVWSGQIGLGQVGSGLVSLGWARLGQVWSV